jgi:hypothetical protein
VSFDKNLAGSFWERFKRSREVVVGEVVKRSG